MSGTMRISMYGNAMMTRMMAERQKRKISSTRKKVTGSISSTRFWSLVKRFRIRPVGLEIKNRRGEWITDLFTIIITIQ